MLNDGCNKMSHCYCYIPHIKQVQGVLQIGLKFQTLWMLRTHPDTFETIQTLENTQIHRTGYQKYEQHFEGLYFMTW